MTTFSRPHGVRICPPIGLWREDDPSIRPTCSECGGDIKVGQPYAVAVSGNAVFCKSCGSQYRAVKI